MPIVYTCQTANVQCTVLVELKKVQDVSGVWGQQVWGVSRGCVLPVGNTRPRRVRMAEEEAGVERVLYLHLDQRLVLYLDLNRVRIGSIGIIRFKLK